MTTTMNTGAASLSDEQKKQIAAVVHCDCTLLPGANFYTAAELAIQATLAQISRAAPTPQADATIAAGGAQEAERYRWLRDRSNDIEWPIGAGWGELGEAEGQEFDAIVDNAMRASNGT